MCAGGRATLSFDATEGFDATLVQWDERLGELAAPDAAALEECLWSMFPAKRALAIRELEQLRSEAPAKGLVEYWRQKRVGFLCAQLAWIAVAESRRPRVPVAAAAS